jgi:hypothetical protein
MSEEVKTVFDKYYQMSEEEMVQENKDLTKNRIQRMFEVGYDDAIDQKLKAEANLKKSCRSNFSCFDLNTYRENKNLISALNDAMKEIEESHVEFFGTDLRNKR